MNFNGDFNQHLHFFKAKYVHIHPFQEFLASGLKYCVESALSNFDDVINLYILHSQAQLEKLKVSLIIANFCFIDPDRGKSWK